MRSRLGNATTLLRLSLLTSLGCAAYACSVDSTDDEPIIPTGAAGSDEAGTGGYGDVSLAGAPTAGGSPAIPTCTSSTPTEGNLSTCAEGYAHRPTATACKILADTAGGASGNGGGGAAADLPRVDDIIDCAGDPHVCDAYQYGFCNNYVEAAAGHWRCESGCVTDSDCGDGSICVCDGPSPSGGVCAFSKCSTDADCGPGLLCASVTDECSSRVSKPNYDGFACQSAQDECVSNADCPGSPGCMAGDDGKRSCSVGICGRPFLVLSEPRLPPATARGDWLENSAPRLDHLTFAERAALAQHWTKLGQMEHASIAAFARFQLQLLALGAPPSLVEQCNQALADETAHTKLCFGIASAYAGRAIGPGPLDVSNSLDVASLLDIVDLVIAEGCFGETSAALEALESANTATDPVIRAAYERIAADEQRHAELAFRFVRWALERGGGEVADRIRAALTTDFAAQHSARSVAEPCLTALVSRSVAA